MKIAYIGSYPPRQCGIGTYTRNKFLSITGLASHNEKHEGVIIAMNDANNKYDYSDEVGYVIRQEQEEDYRDAADFINRSGAAICILEHEFGIFGGPNGIYILTLLQKLRIPYIVVFHTVLKDPSHNERAIFKQVSDKAAATVVMVQKAVELLSASCNIPVERITVIEHGVPDISFDHDECKKELNILDRQVLLTFGLIGRNKGIETVIKAMPQVVAKHPDLLYVVLGKTHPAITRHSGEEYRDSLKAMAKELQVEDNVLFVDEFVDEEKLVKYLHAADIYVTPYLNEAQITSGTLSYALGAGCVVVSTPYWHASELLSGGNGCLFGFRDSETLASILMELLDDPKKMEIYRIRARAYGSQVTWTQIGKKYISLANSIINNKGLKQIRDRRAVTPVLPVFSLDHIRRLTDSTGIIQHAKFTVPNLKEGYCLDDNARALLMTAMAYRLEGLKDTLELMRVYLGYIHYMQTDNGYFRNFLGFNRSFLDEECSEDAFGRTIWALGYLACCSPNESFSQHAVEMINKAETHFDKLKSPRGTANTLIGACYYMKKHPGDSAMEFRIRKMADTLSDHYKRCNDEQWNWFENYLTYDNGLLPLSLFHAAEVLNDPELQDIAVESTDFLIRTCFAKGHLSIIGNSDWYKKGESPSEFAQQPVDAMCLVLLFQKACELTCDDKYLQYLYKSINWFLGKNDLQLPLYDHETKGCYDGLEANAVNKNQGAESTLAWLISRLAAGEVVDGFSDQRSISRRIAAELRSNGYDLLQEKN